MISDSLKSQIKLDTKKEYLLCPSCHSRLHYLAFYSSSKKFVVYADGSMSKKAVENDSPGTLEVGYYFCDKCKKAYDYIDYQQVELIKNI